MPDINLASFAVAKGESGMYGVIGHANFSRPDIGGAPGNDANDARVLSRTHYSIEDLIHCTIAPVTYDQVIFCFRCPGCQCHTMPAILLNEDIGSPASRR